MSKSVDLNEIMPPEVNPFSKSKRQKYFEEQRRNWNDREIQMELLYSQQLLIDKMDQVRGNTNTMIWWLIAIPIAIGSLWILSTLRF